MTELQAHPAKLESERVIINSAMSFTGATQRSFRIGRNQTGVELWAIRVFLVVPLLVVWWVAVAAWYLVVFGLLAVVTIPYRLLRRGARKRKAEAIRHRELMDAASRR